MLQALVWTMALGTSIPAIVLAAECLVALRRTVRPATVPAAPPYVVLMPAHDEAGGIAPVVAAVLQQLRPCDELVVVADNCTDATAEIARELGATVIERWDAARRGKGYALEFGREFLSLRRSGRDACVVIVLDADCVPGPAALPTLAALAEMRQAAVQGAYLLEPPRHADAVVRVSCFAFLVKNLVRQVALDRLAGAALLQGSGMAFPPTMFAGMHWATASLVEDLDMGLDLLLAGRSVIFAENARFVGTASSRQGTAGQRRRWEHGMLQTMTRYVPRLLATAWRQRCAGLAMVALDLLVPPTVLLAMALAAAIVLAALVDGAGLPLCVLLASSLGLGFALLATWQRHARAILPLGSLVQIPGYVLWKVPLLVQFVTRRQRAWLRTERDP